MRQVATGVIGILLLLLLLVWAGPNWSRGNLPAVTRVTATAVRVAPLLSVVPAAIASATPTAPVETPLPTNAAPTATVSPVAVANETAVIPAVAVVANTPTATAPPTPTPVVSPSPRAGYHINGVRLEQIVVMPPETAGHVREIYGQGQAAGRDPHAFSKLGSSLIATSHFLTGLDGERYNLGEFNYLQAAIDQYDGSFLRYGVAIRVGLHTTSVLDPLLANKRWCEPNEDMVSCEIRLNNPTILLILLGTNDTGSEVAFERSLREIAELAMADGVIPVIITKADRFEGLENRNNNIMRRVAAELRIPLCDFDRVAGTLPNRGVGDDDVHLTLFPSLDYSRPEALERGYSTLNLAVLMTLDVIWRTVTEGRSG